MITLIRGGPIGRGGATQNADSAFLFCIDFVWQTKNLNCIPSNFTLKSAPKLLVKMYWSQTIRISEGLLYSSTHPKINTHIEEEELESRTESSSQVHLPPLFGILGTGACPHNRVSK